MSSNQKVAGVLVTGMHRSGTSVVVDLLNAAGLHLGDDVNLIGPNPSQPRGHFEAIEVVALNDQLLELTGRSWLSTNAPDPVALADLASGKLGDQARAFVRTKLTGSGKPWVLKDPRFCLTLPFWREVLHDDFVVVGCLRDPKRVAQSLLERDDLPAAYGAALWNSYNKALIEQSQGLRCTWVTYDHVVGCNAKALGKLSTFIVKSLRAEAADAIGELDLSLIDPDLNRSSSAPIDDSYSGAFAALKKASATVKGPKASAVPWVDTSQWHAVADFVGRLNRDLSRMTADHRAAKSQLSAARTADTKHAHELQQSIEQIKAERAAHSDTNEHLQKSMADHTQTTEELKALGLALQDTQQKFDASVADHVKTNEHLQKSMADHTQTAEELKALGLALEETQQKLDASVADRVEINEHLQTSMADHKATAKDLRAATRNVKRLSTVNDQMKDRLSLRDRDCALLADELTADRRTIKQLEDVTNDVRSDLQAERDRAGELDATVSDLHGTISHLEGDAHRLHMLTSSRAYRMVQAYWFVGRKVKAPLRLVRRDR